MKYNKLGRVFSSILKKYIIRLNELKKNKKERNFHEIIFKKNKKNSMKLSLRKKTLNINCRKNYKGFCFVCNENIFEFYTVNISIHYLCWDLFEFFLSTMFPVFLILALDAVCSHVVPRRPGACLGVRITEYGNSAVLTNVSIISVNNVNNVTDT